MHAPRAFQSDDPQYPSGTHAKPAYDWEAILLETCQAMDQRVDLAPISHNAD